MELIQLRDLVEASCRDRNGEWPRIQRREWDDRCSVAERPVALVSLLLVLEEVLRSLQEAEDVSEVQEGEGNGPSRERDPETQRREMEDEGWVFEMDPVVSGGSLSEEEATGVQYIGTRVRRFFGEGLISDGVVQSYLPPSRNDGVPLWHMVHDDHDEEDLDEDELKMAMEAHATDQKEAPTEEMSDNDVVEEGEGEEGSEDVVSVYDVSDGLRLWPTAGVRQRWREAVTHSRTTAEVALGLVSLIEYACASDLIDVTLVKPRGGTRKSPAQSEMFWGRFQRAKSAAVAAAKSVAEARQSKVETAPRTVTGHRRKSHQSRSDKASSTPQKQRPRRAVKRVVRYDEDDSSTSSTPPERTFRPRRNNVCYAE